MDFKRIILMLTLFFLIFDNYLGMRVFTQFQETQVRQADYQQQSIEQRLSARGIQLLNPLSEEALSGVLVKTEDNKVLSEAMSQLTGQTVTYDDESQTLTGTFETPLSLEGQVTNAMSVLPQETAAFIRDQYLSQSNLFINGQAYTQYWYLPSTKTILFWMPAQDGIPIVDGSAEIRMQLDDNFNIVSYSQTYQSDFVPLEPETPYKLITAKQAIEVLDTRIQTNLPANATIIYVALSYVRYKEWDEVNIYLPVWHVVYQRAEGQTGSMSVDAIKGQVLSR